MSRKIVILGANGRFGRAARSAFDRAGWTVTAVTRGGGPGFVACDARDRDALIRTCRGADVIVHALNPPYHRWADLLPTLTGNVIAAARAAGATVMIPGNVYPYGPDAGVVWRETSPHCPVSRKGHMRVAMENEFAAAASQGVRTVILRGGDFIERRRTGNWFDSFIANRVGSGIVTYPGATDAVHAWAYLPDMARAMAALADKRADFAAFETFHFEGFSLTGDELIAAIAAHQGRPMRRKSVPWGIIRAIGLVRPLMREVVEMRYLWDLPHRLDGTKLAQTLPSFQPIPLRTALSDVLAPGQEGSTTVTQPA